MFVVSIYRSRICENALPLKLHVDYSITEIDFEINEQKGRVRLDIVL